MTTSSLSTCPAIGTPAAQKMGWFDWLRRTLQAVETRRHLMEMDGRMLADIGISRAEALTEAARAPWDLTPPRR